MAELSPARIMEVGFGFWPSKTLLSAVELQLFTVLGDESMTGEELQRLLELSPRANPDFFDALVALGFLERDGDGRDVLASTFQKVADAAQSDSRDGAPIDHVLAPVNRCRPLGDQKRDQFGHLFRPAGTADRDPLPRADVVTMGLILHDWNLEKKMQLIRAAYDALPTEGAFVVIENIIDDARRENVFGLMMSLNMLVEFGDVGASAFVARKSFLWLARPARRWRTSRGTGVSGRQATRRPVGAARCRATSRRVAPSLNKDRTSKSRLTEGSPASIFASRD